jgi:hypothetical protein
MPITIHQLAEHRLGKTGDLTGQDYLDAGLSILGGCQVCHATLAGYNAYPAKTGYWRCSDDIYDEGWETVEEANEAIFGVAVGGAP